MSGTQALNPSPEQTSSGEDVVRESREFRDWPCDRPLPKQLRDHELRAVLGLGHSSFFRRKRAGHFRFLEIQPQLPVADTMYSGALVDRWLDGEMTADGEPRPVTRRFFGSAHALKATRRGRPLATPTFGESK